MRRTKKAAIDIAPVITGLLFLIVIIGSVAVLIWPNLGFDESAESHLETTSNEPGEPSLAEIIFESSAAFPYDWDYTIDDEKIATVTDRLTVNEEAYLEDSKLTIKYHIKGVNPGETKITFTYHDKTGIDTTAIKTRTYSLVVDAALNVTANEIAAD